MDGLSHSHLRLLIFCEGFVGSFHVLAKTGMIGSFDELGYYEG
jgi:hypothetical protein